MSQPFSEVRSLININMLTNDDHDHDHVDDDDDDDDDTTSQLIETL